MRDRKTGRIIWYLFSAVLIKWGVEIAVATFALSCGLHSNMGIGAGIDISKPCCVLLWKLLFPSPTGQHRWNGCCQYLHLGG